ncbi:MAG: PLDc N-terminal domain-containing protein [Marinilabilia sp.]
MESLKQMNGFEWLLVGILFLALIILPVLAILSIFNHDFRGRSGVIWLVIVFVLPVVGPLSYFLLSNWLGRGARIK